MSSSKTETIRHRLLEDELRCICNGRWNEKLVAFNVPDPTDTSHFTGILLSPGSAPTAEYIFYVDIYRTAQTVPHSASYHEV